jgi:hypothetical protein
LERRVDHISRRSTHIFRAVGQVIEMAKHHDPIEEAKALVAKLDAEVSEPQRKLEAARAELARLQIEHEAADRADRLERLPKMAEPATIGALKALGLTLASRAVEQVTALRQTLIECDSLVSQQELIAALAITEAAALGVPSPVRVLGRGLLKGWILDAMRGFGPCNLGLYLSFPDESERDQVILNTLNFGDVPPLGMSVSEYIRELLDSGCTSSEIHSRVRATEAEGEKAFLAAQPKYPLKNGSNWFGHRRREEDEPSPTTLETPTSFDAA